MKLHIGRLWVRLKAKSLVTINGEWGYMHLYELWLIKAPVVDLIMRLQVKNGGKA